MKSWKLVCTGKGNGNDGCGARVVIDEIDLFKTGTKDNPCLTFECPGDECSAWTDIWSQDSGTPPPHPLESTPYGVIRKDLHRFYVPPRETVGRKRNRGRFVRSGQS
jgi:hypothetical protein